MKAIKCLKYGGSENLVLEETEKPSPKDNEVLIKIHATAVTASDVLIRRLNEPPILKCILQLIFGFGKPRNPILGMVSSGIIESKGKSVSSFNIGDEVFAYGSVSPMKRHFGSYAEYICLPEDWHIAHKPTNISHNEAAAIPYGGLLASHLLNKTVIKKGDKVLIYGASGSIGTMAIQLAKNAGALVTSVCSIRNFELVRSLGSDYVIDYTAPDAELHLETYKYVIDAVGNSKSSILKEKSKKAISPKGKYISIDHGTPLTPKDAFLNLKLLVEQEKIKPVIDSIYPLERMAEAHDYVEKGHKRGNVIITV
uniref:Enoyl reductase (ER) domain-containing protein n=1 Tax=Eucampia antarctica TaxID=49252 RepID=A0A7S2SDA3_9STRA|mmetsp:Transcript_6585/g.6186  ORF Transcript_6585/g.6186 Transcript_6585/m.6186 type:complete len:311 (+) Transcript_6585:115-1047(+)|eukprot:CAMPEP_0197827480 /NCGR_PEP_ID=MMETSP1437-20131217/4229_1 /TAXON_ID=49252 ORGANISM="Eucampia antarctica, Strain CCMP1452" /NCGR_SAMPLE_ID=MMETSP1437 /ASSEMBLY_ACC=CAM_ASM_001096 /LENGTH=310 /DNA_ID=CAMNT_0043428313 /DNA_START=97 /DNA_END=1029 /DNA_ORIENTATION=-